jgi:hypothetical protein
VPDYLSHLDDPVKGLKVGVDGPYRRVSLEVQRMLQDVLVVLEKVASPPPAGSRTGRRSTTSSSWCSA